MVYVQRNGIVPDPMFAQCSQPPSVAYETKVDPDYQSEQIVATYSPPFSKSRVGRIPFVVQIFQGNGGNQSWWNFLVRARNFVIGWNSGTFRIQYLWAYLHSFLHNNCVFMKLWNSLKEKLWTLWSKILFHYFNSICCSDFPRKRRELVLMELFCAHVLSFSVTLFWLQFWNTSFSIYVWFLHRFLDNTCGSMKLWNISLEN